MFGELSVSLGNKILHFQLHMEETDDENWESFFDDAPEYFPDFQCDSDSDDLLVPVGDGLEDGGEGGDADAGADEHGVLGPVDVGGGGAEGAEDGMGR